MIANLSIDLDNKWAYLKTAGKLDGSSLPTYLAEVTPHIVSLLANAGAKATIFVVGRDLLCDEGRSAIQCFQKAGHRIGNHSYEHDPWLHQMDAVRLEHEIGDTHRMMVEAGAVAPIGFRGPGFSDSPLVHEILKKYGYRYLASSFPSSVGPMARAYYRMTTKVKADEDRQEMFGTWRNMLAANRPYRMTGASEGLWMFPVTVQPLTRLPFHFTYLFFLAGRSPGLSRLYFRMSVNLCRSLRVSPSLLMHPLDFLGGDEHPDLGFFPGMKLGGEAKRRQLRWFLDYLKVRFQLVSMETHWEQLADRT